MKNRIDKLFDSEKTVFLLFLLVLILALFPFIMSYAKSLTVSPKIKFEYSQDKDLFDKALERSKSIEATRNLDLVSHQDAFLEFEGKIIEGEVFDPSDSGIYVNNGAYYYNPENLRELSNATPEYLNSKLEGTALAGLGQDFCDAEVVYGINAFFLTGLGIHESNFGKSRIFKDKNNMFGMGAYDADPYNKALTFKTYRDSIFFTAGYISKEYLSPNGKYFYGFSAKSVNVKYATDKNWNNAIGIRIEKYLLN